VYDRVFVRPVVWMARANRNDFVDLLYRGIVWLSEGLHRLLSSTETGYVRWYALVLGIGAALLVAMGVLL
jgi:NADH-quinone oxidoreductase subunit L